MFICKKLLFLSLSVLIYTSAVSADSLSKNHKKAIAYDCKYNLNNDFDSVNECKNLLVVSLKRDGVLFNLSDFKGKKIKKAERACSKRIQQGVYKYNMCLAEMLGVNVEIDEPPIVVANNELEDDNIVNNDVNEDNENDNDNKTTINEQPEETNKEIILTANDIYNIVVPSSFQVWATDNPDSENWVCGSSVVIKQNLLATNCHVVLNKFNKPHSTIALINHKDDIKVESNWNEAKVIAKDPKNDICVVESLSVTAPPVKIKEYKNIEMLEKAYVVGGPECRRGVMTSGEIQAKHDSDYSVNIEGEQVVFTVPLLQTNAHIRGGNSGGGLFDKNGNLMGITTLGEIKNSSNPFNIAISADNFIKLLNK